MHDLFHPTVLFALFLEVYKFRILQLYMILRKLFTFTFYLLCFFFSMLSFLFEYVPAMLRVGEDKEK